MPVVEFTQEILANLPTLCMWQERLDWVYECATRPDGPQLVHRALFADPEVDVHGLVREAREYVAGIRRHFYDKGTLPREHRVVAEILYQTTVY